MNCNTLKYKKVSELHILHNAILYQCRAVCSSNTFANLRHAYVPQRTIFIQSYGITSCLSFLRLRQQISQDSPDSTLACVKDQWEVQVSAKHFLH